MPGAWQVSGGVDHGRQARHEPATDGLAVCHGCCCLCALRAFARDGCCPRETDTRMSDGLTASAAVCTPLSYVRLRQNVAAQAPGRRADLDV